MRIAYVITRADAVGGATIHVRDLARAMNELGHETLVLVGGRGRVTEQFEAAGLRVHSLHYLRRAIHPLKDLLAVRELTAALRDFAPDLVSTHTAKAGWVGRAAAARLGLPAIYTPHGLAVGERFPAASRWMYTLAERGAARWTSVIICVCEAEMRLALDRGIARPDQLTVIHNGVRDIAQEYRACPDREPVRICTIARFESPKDFPTLLAALACLGDRHWTLDIVGEGPLETETRSIATSLGITGQIRFLGYQSDPAPVLAASQLFVLASRSEAFPRGILEAMRAGLPVVTTDVGGANEAVVHGVTGLIVPPGDPSAMAAAIAELLDDSSVRRAFGEAAREMFEQRFRLEHTVANVLPLYRAVLGKT